MRRSISIAVVLGVALAAVGSWLLPSSSETQLPRRSEVSGASAVPDSSLVAPALPANSSSETTDGARPVRDRVPADGRLSSRIRFEDGRPAQGALIVATGWDHPRRRIHTVRKAVSDELGEFEIDIRGFYDGNLDVQLDGYALRADARTAIGRHPEARKAGDASREWFLVPGARVEFEFESTVPLVAPIAAATLYFRIARHVRTVTWSPPNVATHLPMGAYLVTVETLWDEMGKEIDYITEPIPISVEGTAMLRARLPITPLRQLEVELRHDPRIALLERFELELVAIGESQPSTPGEAEAIPSWGSKHYRANLDTSLRVTVANGKTAILQKLLPQAYELVLRIEDRSEIWYRVPVDLKDGPRREVIDLPRISFGDEIQIEFVDGSGTLVFASEFDARIQGSKKETSWYRDSADRCVVCIEREVRQAALLKDPAAKIDIVAQFPRFGTRSLQVPLDSMRTQVVLRGAATLEVEVANADPRTKSLGVIVALAQYTDGMWKPSCATLDTAWSEKGALGPVEPERVALTVSIDSEISHPFHVESLDLVDGTNEWKLQVPMTGEVEFRSEEWSDVEFEIESVKSGLVFQRSKLASARANVKFLAHGDYVVRRVGGAREVIGTFTVPASAPVMLAQAASSVR